ncbi:MAG: hypothetical protein SVX43_09605 [Cyanobacteriota bacterium]|nr:hypothetical protein [Cyanobacteriota bacterium]
MRRTIERIQQPAKTGWFLGILTVERCHRLAEVTLAQRLRGSHAVGKEQSNGETAKLQALHPPLTGTSRS